MRLRTRFTLAIGGMVSVLFLLYTTAFLILEHRHLSYETEKNHRLNTNHLALACNNALLTKDELGLVDFLNELKTSPDFLEAYCLKSDGNLLIHSDLKLKNKNFAVAPPAVTNEKIVLTRDSQLVSAYAAPIFRFNRSVGTAWVFYKEEAVQQRRRILLRQTAHRLAWLTMGVFGVALVLSASLAKAFTRPISEVVAGTRRLGRGELDTRVWEMGPGELGDLGREFNTMAQKLKDLETMKDHFIQTVSHDLRNPLSAIATSANVLLSDQLPATSLPLVEVIESSAVRLRTMVNNILDVAKMREGRLTFERTVFPVNQILKELTRLYLPMAKESDKILHLNLPEDLPPLDADEEKVLRIFLNLLTNAFKFTREGDTITIAASPEGERRLEFRISDTGLGIDPDRQANIFQPFRSVEGAASGDRHRQGTGLGLSIVKTLVEGHGGRIQLQSIPGNGTTVVFTLPCQAPPR